MRDYDRYIRDRRKVADVEATKAILVSLAAIKVSDSLLSDDYKLRDVISLWQSYPPSEVSPIWHCRQLFSETDDYTLADFDSSCD